MNAIGRDRKGIFAVQILEKPNFQKLRKKDPSYDRSQLMEAWKSYHSYMDKAVSERVYFNMRDNQAICDAYSSSSGVIVNFFPKVNKLYPLPSGYIIRIDEADGIRTAHLISTALDMGAGDDYPIIHQLTICHSCGNPLNQQPLLTRAITALTKELDECNKIQRSGKDTNYMAGLATAIELLKRM